MIITGDSTEQLKKLPENSVDSIVTDPPYGLSFMGKKWDYDVPSVELWQEVLRVLKPGGHLLSFAGSRTYHRMAVNIEDAGFEIRDQIMWVYGSGFPKSLNIGKAVDKLQGNEREDLGLSNNHRTLKETNTMVGEPHSGDGHITKGNSPYEGYGTALKPAHEPIVVARKPISEKSIAENTLKWGTGGINIDASRVGTETLGGGTMPDLRDVGAMSKENSGIDKLSFGQNHRPATRKEQPEYTGRFPANFIHDGSDEVVGLFPDTKSGAVKQYTNNGANQPINLGGGMLKPTEGSSGSAARFFYCAKAGKSERNKGLEEFEEKRNSDRIADDGVGGDNPRNRGVNKTQNHHPTVKPIKLMQYLVKLVTPKGGTVLDPFNGSGTTGIACKLEGFDYIGIELDPEYVKISEARIEAWQPEAQAELELA